MARHLLNRHVKLVCHIISVGMCADMYAEKCGFVYAAMFDGGVHCKHTHEHTRTRTHPRLCTPRVDGCTQVAHAWFWGTRHAAGLFLTHALAHAHAWHGTSLHHTAWRMHACTHARMRTHAPKHTCTHAWTPTCGVGTASHVIESVSTLFTQVCICGTSTVSSCVCT